MPEYRLFLHGRGGRLERGETFHAPDDGVAIATASANLERPAELWEGGRRVQVLQSPVEKPLRP